MRKLLLTVLALVMLSSSCLAANWEWIASDEKIGMFYDKDSIVFDMSKDKITNRDKCYVWVKIVYDKAFAQKRFKDNTAASLEHWGFDLANNQMLEGERIYYDDSGLPIEKIKGAQKWVGVVPDTFAEAVKEKILRHVKVHTEEIEQRTRGAH
jgi:hypothetical protein